MISNRLAAPFDCGLQTAHSSAPDRCADCGPTVCVVPDDAGGFAVVSGAVPGAGLGAFGFVAGAFGVAGAAGRTLPGSARYCRTACSALPIARASKNLCDVVAVKAGDVLLIGRSQLLLRLDHFHVIGDAGGKAVLRLHQRLLRKVQSGLRDLHLFGSGLQIQQSILNVLLNTASQVVDLRLTLLEDRSGLLNVGLDFAALKNRNRQRRCRRPVRSQRTWREADYAVVARKSDRRQTLLPRCLLGVLRRPSAAASAA